MKIEQIQIGRGIAALIVAFHHLLLPQLQMIFHHNTFFDVVHLNYLGDFAVYFFFCISGFVMIHSCIERPKSAKGFILDRIVRIYPLYIIFTLLSLIVFHCTRGELSWLINLNYYPKNISELISALTLIPPLYNSEFYAMPLATAWSLVYEIFFYALFAILLIFFKIKYIPYILLVCFLVSFLIINPLFEPARGRWVNWLYVVSDIINLCFAIGTILYFAPKLSMVNNKILGFILLTILIVLMLCPDLHESKVTLIFFITMVFYLLLSFQYKETSIGRFLCYLGNASYSIYLTHIVFNSLSWHAIKIHWAMGLNLFISTIIFGCIIHEYLEKPLGKFFRSKIAYQK